ncbi:acyl-CoA dehydrogenase family protein [Streptomyces sp. NPDC020883]|uniref:acyl-CoA dehydrogenase family protein n=1 Tax=unclassified Streptomyces TaxID=2593676 RepID=UPI0034E1F30D
MQILDRATELRTNFRDFCENKIRPLAEEIEGSQIHHGVVELLAATGWHGLAIPREHGGMDLGHLARLISIEEVSRVSAAAGAALQSAQLGVAMIVNYGSPEQKERYLPDLAEGRRIASICITEPESGSHVLGMGTTARREGDEYVLNGRKWFIANSHVAHVHGVVAKTSDSGRRDSLTAFLVDADTPGCRAGVTHDITGLKGFNLGEVVFEDCRIPASAVVGGQGNGLEVGHRSITEAGKPNLTAVALGIHQAVLEDVTAYADQRQMYGKPLAALDSVRARIADIYTDLQLSRISAYQAADLLDHGQAADEWLLIAKLTATENAVTAARHGNAVLGARGGLSSFRMDRHLRDALLTLAPAGTSDVQRKRIADVALGRYNAPWYPSDAAPAPC